MYLALSTRGILPSIPINLLGRNTRSIAHDKFLHFPKLSYVMISFWKGGNLTFVLWDLKIFPYMKLYLFEEEESVCNSIFFHIILNQSYTSAKWIFPQFGVQKKNTGCWKTNFAKWKIRSFSFYLRSLNI